MIENDAPSAGRTSLVDSVMKFAAVLDSLVALGQTASTWIDGIYKAAAEKEKTAYPAALQAIS